MSEFIRSIKQRLLVLGLVSIAQASEDGLVLVPLPLDTIQGEIVVVDVPFIIGKALPETAFSAIGHPYLPPSISFHEQGDINLASVAGIKVLPMHQSGRLYRIELDYGEVDEAYHTEELLAAVLDCVFRVAGGPDGYTLEVSLTNLENDSELHGKLKKLLADRGKNKKKEE